MSAQTGNSMRLAFVPLAAFLGMTGCIAATRTTVKLVQAEKNMTAARDAGAQERAVYAWTLADEYMKKARDEWARSDFEASESMVKKAKYWADEAASIARAAPILAKEAMEDDTFLDKEAMEDEASPEVSTPTEAMPEAGVWQ
jgi:hypothetical protein